MFVKTFNKDLHGLHLINLCMFLKSHFKEYENLILTYCKFSCITLAFYMML